jgi:hypothetical protein
MTRGGNPSSKKFGGVDPNGGPGLYPYSGTWSRQSTSSGERLLIAPRAGSHIAVLEALARCLPEPFSVLYVLVVSRRGEHATGRYQSPGSLSTTELGDFLTRFATYFEQDGRHHLWLHCFTNGSTLVYDRHDIIYAYGPVEPFEGALRGEGLVAGEVEIPTPHQHAYHPEFDETEGDILRHWEWRCSPLQPADEA